MWPENPGSINPAVEWVSRPRRPSEDLPSDAGIVDQMRKRVIELDGGHVIRDQVRGVYGYTG